MIKKTEEEIMKNWKAHDGEKPLVSICSVTFNHEDYIAMSLDGMLMQETNFPFEIVIRDDCSTDKTALIIEEYVKKYPHIIKPIFEQENQWSKGVKPLPIVTRKAIGKYIALCEGDDYWTDPSQLQKQCEFLEKNTDYSLCYSGATAIDDVTKQVLIKNKNFGDSSSNELIAGIGNAVIQSVMYRKFDIEEFSKFDIINGDSLLWHFLGFYGKCKYIGNIKDSVYRIHDGGIWSKSSEQHKLTNSIKTYTAIRNHIISKFGEESHLLKMHDTLYPPIFHDYFYKSIKKLKIKQYIFGLSTLLELDHSDKKNIYLYHLKKILYAIARSIKTIFFKKKIK